MFKRLIVGNYSTAASSLKFIESISNATKGINLASLQEVIKIQPELMNTPPEVWQLRHDLLKQNGFRLNDFVKMISNCPLILKTPSKQLLHSIDGWRATQFGEKNVTILLETHPYLFNCNETAKLVAKVEMLRDYLGSRKNVFTLFMNSPELAFTKLNEIQTIIDYVENKMGCTNTDILKSKVFSSSLENLKYRHIFLKRLGLFKTPKRNKVHKANKNNSAEKTAVQNKNPSLHHIIDTNDRKFATKIGFVTLEEYEVFRELYKRELDKRDHLSDGDAELSDNEDDQN